VRPHQSFCLYSPTRTGCGGVIPELKLRLKFYCSWTCFSFFPVALFIYLFVLSSWFFKIFIPIFLFSFLYYQLYLHHLLILTLTLFILPPSPVLKSIALLPKYSFYPFSSTLFPHPQLTLPFFPTCHQTTPPFYILTTCWPTYYTNFTQVQLPEISDSNTLYYNNRNTLKYTQGPQNPAAPTLLPNSATPYSASTFSATLTNSLNFYS
jgi:hypothetical protein